MTQKNNGNRPSKKKATRKNTRKAPAKDEQVTPSAVETEEAVDPEPPSLEDLGARKFSIEPTGKMLAFLDRFLSTGRFPTPQEKVIAAEWQVLIGEIDPTQS